MKDYGHGRVLATAQALFSWREAAKLIREACAEAIAETRKVERRRAARIVATWYTDFPNSANCRQEILGSARAKRRKS